MYEQSSSSFTQAIQLLTYPSVNRSLQPCHAVVAQSKLPRILQTYSTQVHSNQQPYNAEKVPNKVHLHNLWSLYFNYLITVPNGFRGTKHFSPYKCCRIWYTGIYSVPQVIIKQSCILIEKLHLYYNIMSYESSWIATTAVFNRIFEPASNLYRSVPQIRPPLAHKPPRHFQCKVLLRYFYPAHKPPPFAPRRRLIPQSNH